MSKKFIYMFRGIGMGLVLAGIIVFALKGQLVTEVQVNPTNEEIVKMAGELGMVPVTRAGESILSDEEIIKLAKELGMEFVE